MNNDDFKALIIFIVVLVVIITFTVGASMYKRSPCTSIGMNYSYDLKSCFKINEDGGIIYKEIK